ncbi:MAG: DUF72 domain-containing protein [Chloroflexi bacterium]|nr:DUF72 domain-containing protein [Chloroflexota bacterium]MBL7062165.1 DUF72 domain-containing protein [Dehalococcoidia bacterium]
MPDNARIYIGTSGWSYPKGEGTWAGYFYPSGKVNELEYYSQFFNTVEVNSSFYRPPNPGYVYNWVKRVPKDFFFTVKLWQKFTHPKMYKEATGEEAAISQEDVDRFRQSIEPLANSGKLGALLAQFPPSFKNDKYGQQILQAVIRTFGSYRLGVELRHRSWSDDPNFPQLLCDNNISWVHIDEPKFQSSVSAEVPQTSDVAYFRFHGRNKEMWWQGDNETRYKYLYSTEEIQDLASKVREAAGKTNLMFAFFNNHWQGYAPRNAVDLQRSLQLPFKDVSIQIPLQDDNQPENR